MSLRKVFIVLLFANVAYFGYTQGWLNALSGADNAQREPERMSHQINGEAIQVTAAHEAPAAAKVNANKSSVVPIPIIEASAPAEIPTVASLANCTPEQWMVYMGPYPNQAASDKKKNELTHLDVSRIQEVSKPLLKFGLALGQFSTEALARQELKRLNGKGIRTATVVLWSAAACP